MHNLAFNKVYKEDKTADYLRIYDSNAFMNLDQQIEIRVYIINNFVNNSIECISDSVLENGIE